MNLGKLIYAERRSRLRRGEILDRALKLPPAARALAAPEETGAATAPAAPLPPTCQYQHRNDAGQLHECGAPAKYRGVKGARLYYCNTCAEMARRYFELATLDGHSLGAPLYGRKRS